MKTQTVKKLAVLAITLVTTVSVTQAFAQNSQVASASWRAQDNAPGMGKTRAQVYAEMVQAEEAGVIPAGNTHNPLTPAMIETNRIRFALAERYWKSHADVNAQ